jgi:hypothetical protein
MARFEHKYLVEEAMLPELRRRLLPFVHPDSFAVKMPGYEYATRSVYYDTPTMRVYQEKEIGIAIRKKLRIRVYNQREKSSVAFLEVKAKNVDCVTKYRAPLLYDNVERLLTECDPKPYVFTNNGYGNAIANAERFLFFLNRELQFPFMLVAYDREAYQGIFDGTVRLTFDKHLRTGIERDLGNLFREPQLVPALKGLFVFEVKFERSTPSWLRPILAEFNLTRTSVSKYCHGVKAALMYDRFAAAETANSLSY